MARIAAHTQEQVFQAADGLAAAGQEVSTGTLREVLGRGSFSTLGRHLAEWQQQRQPLAAPVALPMPDSVQAAFAQCWKAAAAEAGKEILAIREQHTAETQRLQQRLNEALAEIERLEAEANSDAAKLEAAETALQGERTRAERLASDAASATATAREEAAQLRGELSAIRSLNSELLAHLQTAEVLPAEKPKMAAEKPTKPAPKKSAKMRKPAVQLSLD